jgi:WD40 repeat protein
MLVVAIALLVFALISRQNAVSAESSANAQRLAALSENQLSIDPERAVLLAMAAVRKDATYGTSGTMFALRATLDDSTIRYRLAPAGVQKCGSLYPQFDPAPGSNLLAEGLCDGKVRFFNATTGRLERIVTVGSPKDQAILLGYPADRAVLEGAVGNRLVALNPVTAAVERRGPIVPDLGADGFDPSGPLVAAVGRLGRLVVWNYDTGRVTVRQLKLPTANLTDVSFGGPGLLALSFLGGNPGTTGVVLYDYVRRRFVATETAQGAGNIAYSPNGQWLAVGAQAADGTGTVELLNGRTLAVDRAFHPVRDRFEGAAGLAWSVDGRYLAYGFADGSAGLLDAATGRLVHSYAYATSPVFGLAISRNDRLLVTSSGDGTTVAFSTSSRVLRTIQTGGSIAQLAVVPDGFVTIANPGPRPGEGVVVERFRDQGSKQSPPLVLFRSANTIAASLSPFGTVAATAPGGPRVQTAPLHVWSVGARRVISTIRFPNGVGDDPVIGPGGSVIATGVGPLQGFHPHAPSTFELIDLRTGRRRVIAGSSCPWQDWAFDQSGETVAAATFCGQVSAWSVTTGRRLGSSIQVLGAVNSLAFSPGGRSLAIAVTNGTVYEAPVPLTETPRQLNVSTKSAQAVAFSPNGRYLTSAGLDLTARIYNARTLTELRVIPLTDPPQGIAFTADSQDLLTWDAAGTVRLWDACTDCENPPALLALARSRVTRSLTPAERASYGVG